MADECTDVSTIEELYIFCRCPENGEPMEHFIELVPLKTANAESIHSAMAECLTFKNIQLSIQLSKLSGMGFDGAATFLERSLEFRQELKKHPPHPLFVHCHCHQLQLACIQAANATMWACLCDTH